MEGFALPPETGMIEIFLDFLFRGTSIEAELKMSSRSVL
jgi:hypothetical protein